MSNESTKNLPGDNLGNNPFIRGREVTVQADKNGLVQIQSDSPIRGVLVLESDVQCTASVAYNRNGYAKIRLTRTWEFLERLEIGVTGSTKEFETQLSASDTEIRINGYWKSSADAGVLFYTLNGADSSGIAGTDTASLDTRTGTGATAAGLILAKPQAAVAAEHTLTSTLTIGTSEPRLLTGVSSTTDGTAGTNVNGYALSGHWETLTEIKNVGVDAVVANHLIAGSWFELSRRPNFNKTKIKLWVY